MSLLPNIATIGTVTEIHGSPTLRTILNRVDGLHDGTSSQFVVSKAVDTQISVYQACLAEMALMLRGACKDRLSDNGRLAAAFCGGFGLPLLIGLLLVLPMLTAPLIVARPVALLQQQNNAALVASQDRSVSAFAAPSLMGPPTMQSLSSEAPLALIVPGQVEAEVGRATPFSINFSERGQVPLGSLIRIASLPPYVGLSVGHPGAAGTWLIDPQAVSDLNLTVYTVNSATQIVDIELVDLNGGLLARTQTNLAVKAASLELPRASLAVAQPRAPLIAVDLVMAQPAHDLVLKPTAPKIGFIKAIMPIQAPVVSVKRASVANTGRITKDSPRSAKPIPKVTTKPSPPRVTASNAQVPPIEVAFTGSGRSASQPKERAPATWSAAWQRSALGYAPDRP